VLQGEVQERTWQAFWRTTVDGRAAADVAAELGMQPGSVYQAKSRLLARLRELLAAATGE
jgi:RNA polymerase sigma-70 factor (ECF subfamily)